MGVLVNGRYYPSEVTDFLTPAEKAAEEAKRIAEQAYQDSVAHEQNKMDTFIDPVDTINKTLKGFGDLLSINKSIKDAGKAAEARKDKKTDTTLKDIVLPKDEKAFSKALEIKQKFRDGDQEVIGEHIKWTDFVNKQTNLSPALRDYLRDSSSGELLRAAKWQGLQTVTDLPGKFYDYTQSLTGDARRAWEVKYGDTKEGTQSAYIEFAKDELSKLGISDGLIANTFVDTIRSNAETLGTGAAVLYSAKSKSKQAANFLNNIKPAIAEVNAFINEGSDKDDTRVNAVTQFIHQQVEELGEGNRELGKERVAALLTIAGVTDELSLETIGDIEQGLNLGHPAGKHGDVLLTPEQFLRIETAIIDRGKQKVKAHDTKVDNVITVATGQAASGSLTVKQHAAKLIELEQVYGLLPTSEKYKKFQNLNLNAQTQDYYKAEKAEVIDLLTSGRPVDFEDTISGIQNTRLRREMENKAGELATSKERNKWPATNYDNAATELLDKRLTEVTLLTGRDLPYGSTQLARNFISQEADRIYFEEFLRSEPGDTTVASRARKRLNERIEELGIDKKPNEAGAGILSHDIEGRFPHFDTYDTSKAEGSRGDAIQTTQRVSQIWKNPDRNASGRTQKERVVNSLGVLTVPELVAVSQMARNGEITSWPPDVLLTAEILGVQPSVLVKAQLEQVINRGSDTDKQTAKVFKFDQLLKDIPTADVEVRKFIEKTGDKDLLSYYEHLGINSITDNQWNRILSFEKQIADQPKIDAQRDVKIKEINDAKKEKEENDKKIRELRRKLRSKMDITWPSGT